MKNKQKINRACLEALLQESGTAERVAILAATANCLMLIVEESIEEAQALLDSYGLQIQQLKPLQKKAARACDEYFKFMSKMFKGIDLTSRYKDASDFVKEIQPDIEDWEPTPIPRTRITELEKQYGIKINGLPCGIDDEK